eukprot:TRINITY_DN42972_c0_g1_i1.p1 TRINITY_DN42972_c0_g1~~TRINITY_DN42972_c0_g1_i1.p1  ORF type:complete len:871 (+),score=385.23 TRINITY_DN42972_c0_g1_i1:107-2614(+)
MASDGRILGGVKNAGRITQIDPKLFQKDVRVARVPPELMRRYKAVLLGHEEVGKTSIRKCWESDPLFFKKLPEVLSTTGIECRTYKLKYPGHGAGGKNDDVLDLNVHDFAGQEVYHSHSLFLTPRTVYIFVWKMSNVDHDGAEPAGMSEFEEERMMTWLDEVYSKAPGSACVIIGTHVDELRDQRMGNVNRILRAVKRRFEEYIQSIRLADGETLQVTGSYAVSCKARQAFGEQFQSEKGAKMSDLLKAIGEVAFQRCLSDQQFPAGAVPGRHVQFLAELERLQKQRMTVLLPLQEFAQIAARYGIESTQELADCTMLFHCWSVLYVFTTAKQFTPQHLEANPWLFLHPLWLARMVPALFSMAHVVYTTPDMRKYIGGLEYSPEEALRADRCDLRQGELNSDLAAVIFAPSIRNLRQLSAQQPPTRADVEMCIQLLIGMDLVYRTAEGRQFVPSLFPLKVPGAVRDYAPYLFQKGTNRMYQFNIFPKEFYNRLTCRLQHVMKTFSIAVTKPVEAEKQQWGSDVQYMPPQKRPELRNHWKDAMWLGGRGVRAIVVQEESTIQAYISPDLGASSQADALSADDLRQLIDDSIEMLATEYSGLAVTTCVQCPGCEAYFDTSLVRDNLSREQPTKCTECGTLSESAQLLGCSTEPMAAGDLWTGIWEAATFAIGDARAAGLLRALDCYVEPDAGVAEADLPADGDQAARWLDRLVWQLMLDSTGAEVHDADAEQLQWEAHEDEAAKQGRERSAKLKAQMEAAAADDKRKREAEEQDRQRREEEEARDRMIAAATAAAKEEAPAAAADGDAPAAADEPAAPAVHADPQADAPDADAATGD